MDISITYEIERDEEMFEIEVTGDFYHGELEDFSVYPKIKLTPVEEDKCVDLLILAYGESWDEDSWKSERDRG